MLGFIRNIIFLLLCFTYAHAQEIVHKHTLHHSFIENKGQWHENVLFHKKINGGNMWIEQNKVMFHLQDFSNLQKAHINPRAATSTDSKQDLIHLNFIGSNKVNSIQKDRASLEYYNYFLGNKEKKWASEVRGYQEFILEDIYDEIDLKFIEDELNVKYEFHLQPKTNPDIIQLEYVNQQGIRIDRKGNLEIETKLGKIIEQKPYAYQIKNGKL